MNPTRDNTTPDISLLIYMTLMILLITLIPFRFHVPVKVEFIWSTSAKNLISNLLLFIPIGFLFRHSEKKTKPFLLESLRLRSDIEPCHWNYPRVYHRPDHIRYRCAYKWSRHFSGCRVFRLRKRKNKRAGTLSGIFSSDPFSEPGFAPHPAHLGYVPFIGQ